MTDSLGGGGRTRAHSLPLALLGAATLAPFLSSLPLYHELWTREPFTHGYLIAAATIWLVWRERHALGWQRPTDRSGLLVIVAMLSFMWAIGGLARVQLVTLTLIPFIALGWVALAMGMSAARRLAPAAAVFLLSAPFWGVLYTPLRLLTVRVNQLALTLIGVPAEFDGTLIHLQYGTFSIADACAGINYFMAGLSLGAIYALGFVRGWRGRATIISAAVLVSLVGNWIRVTSLIVVGHVTRMESGLIQDHGAYGWVLFTVALALLYPVTVWIDRRERATPVEAAAEEAAPTPPTMARVSVGGAVPASLAVVVGPLLVLVLGALPVDPSPTPPLTPSGVWARADEPLTGWTPAFVGADARETSDWADTAATVHVERLTYTEQEQGAELIGNLSRIAHEDSLVVERTVGPVGPERLFVREAIVRDDRGALLVWYWYTVAGVDTSSALRAKLLEVPAFVRRVAAAHVTAVAARCDPEDCNGAASALYRFMAAS